MSEARLPAHLEVAGILRAVETAGGFAAVLHKGERDAGTIALVTMGRGSSRQLWERMPRSDGGRPFAPMRAQMPADQGEFDEYLARRIARDGDSWFLELDIADPAQFVAMLGT